MSAMDNATRNAGDMIDKLTLNYNRTRQAQITKELIEIISGAEGALSVKERRTEWQNPSGARTRSRRSACRRQGAKRQVAR